MGRLDRIVVWKMHRADGVGVDSEEDVVDQELACLAGQNLGHGLWLREVLEHVQGVDQVGFRDRVFTDEAQAPGQMLRPYRPDHR